METKSTHIVFPVVTPKKDPNLTMKAVQWFGKADVRVVEVPRPMITEPKDALLRITATTICGSDLHLYHSEVPGMEKGDILGHEFMGIVEQIGSEVKNIQVGDRVVASFDISCGECDYCKREEFTLCDNTNPSTEMEKLYGHRISGAFGYSHLTGGYDGGQAEYVRVPFADVNLLKIPETVPDEKALYLSDILCTGWHANELAQIKEGDTVAIWGAGPVGICAAMWAKFRKAKKIVIIDGVAYRLQCAREALGIETINFTEHDVTETMKILIPGGPDACIDAVGFRFPKTLLHKFQRAIKLETDAPEVLKEIITCVRKGGKIGVVGDYFANANQFPIGAFMEKGLSMSGGQSFTQKYWKQILEYLEKGQVDPTFLITHKLSLEDAVQAYKIFDEKKDNMIKVFLRPGIIKHT
jgi:threonine dehydrogenase-like Zn-dependent dehydrogenase